RAWGAAAILAALPWVWLAVSPGAVHPGAALEVIGVAVPRPLQLVFDARTLVILSPGARGDTAGEIYRLDLGGDVPRDLSNHPRLRIPFVDSRPAALGRLPIDPKPRDLVLGEADG